MVRALSPDYMYVSKSAISGRRADPWLWCWGLDNRFPVEGGSGRSFVSCAESGYVRAHADYYQTNLSYGNPSLEGTEDTRVDHESF